MNVKKLDDPFYDRLHLLLNETRSETNRGKALVTASLIEEMLEEVLRNFLLENSAIKKLFQAPNAPLSTFSAKIAACRALGLISHVEFRDIDFIRQIRNQFAHNILCSFHDEKIKSWTEKIQAGMTYIDSLEKGHESRVKTPEQRFILAATALVTALYNRAHYVRLNRLEERVWQS